MSAFPFGCALQEMQTTVSRMDSVAIESIQWIWEPVIARRNLHALVTTPAVDSAALLLQFAAVVTRGGQWPAGYTAPAASVIYWPSYTNASQVIQPRFQAANGDPSRLFIVNADVGAFDFSRHTSELEALIRTTPDIGLVIVQVPGHSASTRAAKQLERELFQLQRIAEYYNCAILLEVPAQRQHSRSSGLDGLGSSSPFRTVCSVMIACTEVADLITDCGRSQFVMTCTKSKIGSVGGGISFQVVPQPLGNGTSAMVVQWQGILRSTPKEILTFAETHSSQHMGAVEVAAEFLLEFLAGGPRRFTEIVERAAALNISEDALKKAKRAGGIIHRRLEGSSTKWTWDLPIAGLQPAPSAGVDCRFRRIPVPANGPSGVPLAAASTDNVSAPSAELFNVANSYGLKPSPGF